MSKIHTNVIRSRMPFLKETGRSRIAYVALLLTVGCNRSAADRGSVTGTVTIDGSPPAAGSITFTPVDGMSPTAGGTIVDGKYSVEVPLGKSKVAIRVSKVVGERKMYDHPQSPVQPVLEEVLPAKYNDSTELTIDVAADSNSGDFDLRSK